MRVSAGTSKPQKYLAIILSASMLRAHLGQPRASVGSISPQSRQGSSFIDFTRNYSVAEVSNGVS
jgi:hypothetical protein